MTLLKRQTADNLVYLPVFGKNSGQYRMRKNTDTETQLRDWRKEMALISENQDKAAYRSLYLYFAPKVQAFLAKQGLSDKAEELTHEVFIKIWQKSKTYNPSKAQVSTWIFTIVRNMRIDFLRKKKLDAVSVDEEGYSDDSLDLENVTELKRNQVRLFNVFKKLSTEQRNVLQKVYFEDKSHQLAAEELDMTLGVVKSRVRSALMILRATMGDHAE